VRQAIKAKHDERIIVITLLDLMAADTKHYNYFYINYMRELPVQLTSTLIEDNNRIAYQEGNQRHHQQWFHLYI